MLFVRSFSLTVATTVIVRVPMSMTAGYVPAPRLSKSIHYHTRPLHAAVESPLSLESSDDSSYVPYEHHMHIPSADAYSAQGAPQQRAPSRLGSRTPPQKRKRFWAVWDPYYGHAKFQALAPSRARVLNSPVRLVVRSRDGAILNQGPLRHENWDCARLPGSNRSGIEMYI